MWIKTIALATALTMGLASVAVARSGGTRGARELGSGRPASGGVNPAEHRALGGKKPDLITSDGKCWALDKAKIGGWGDCPSAKHHKA